MILPLALLRVAAGLVLLVAALPVLPVLRAPDSLRAGEGAVRLLRLPEGGIQPQAALDARGGLHLIYFRGDPAGGDVFYVRRSPGEERFSAPLRVNSQPGSVIAVGTVRGAHLAVGKDGRAHVAWMGSGAAEPRGPGGAAPMLYARLDDAGTAFEPQRNVMRFAAGLDGGASVAADARGNVYVVWHGRGEREGEEHRRVWMARSSDEGAHFAPEAAIDAGTSGACGCCGMRALADAEGRLHVVYRGARQGVRRDMRHIASSPGGAAPFEERMLHPWELSACPMSTSFLHAGSAGVRAAWETDGQVYFGAAAGDGSEEAPVAAPGSGRGRRHPVIARNDRGEVLLVWTEGTAWNRGGHVAWQRYDAAGRPAGPVGRAEGVPVWGLAAAVGTGDGFTILY